VPVLAAIVAVVVLVLIAALILDIRDRRHGRRSRVRIAGWLDRSGQVSAASSLEGYVSDAKGVGSSYSSERLRGSDQEHPPTD